MKVWHFLFAIIRSLVRSAPEETPLDERSVLTIRKDGTVEPLVLIDGWDAEVVEPGSRNDPFTVLHREDRSSLILAAEHYLSTGQYDKVADVLYRLRVQDQKEETQA